MDQDTIDDITDTVLDMLHSEYGHVSGNTISAAMINVVITVDMANHGAERPSVELAKAFSDLGDKWRRNWHHA